MSSGQYFWPLRRHIFAYPRVKRAIEAGATGPGAMSAQLAHRLSTTESEAFLTVSGTEALWIAASVARAMLPRQTTVPSAFVPAYGIPCIWTTFAREFFSEAIDVESNGLISKRTLHQAAVKSKAPNVVLAVWQGGAGGALLDDAHEWARAHDCIYVEDMACAVGEVPKQMGIYSFSAPKLHSAGQGGAVVLNKTWHRYEEARALLVELMQVCAGNGFKFRETGKCEASSIWHYEHISNRRLSDVSCAMMLDELDADPKKRGMMLKVQQELEQATPDNVARYYGPLHNVIFPANVAVFEAQARRLGVGIVRPYGHASKQAYGARCVKVDTPNAQRWADGAVYLPFGPGLADANDNEAAHTLRSMVDLVRLADIQAEAA